MSGWLFSLCAFEPMIWFFCLFVEKSSIMDYNDIVVSLLAAAAMGSLACLGSFKTDKEERKDKAKLQTDDVDRVALTAIITFIAMMVARHPEWVA